MKKTMITALLGAGTAIGACAQSQEVLDINNITAQVYSQGLLFNDSLQGTGGFEAPAGSGTNSIYAANLWYGGVDVNGQLKIAADVYSSQQALHYGPVMTNPTQMPAFWNRVWKINKSAIDSFVDWFELGVLDQMNGTTVQTQTYPNYVIPQIILDWPAHGDVALGMNFNMAPFYDRDQDGVYNPVSGDYPLIRGDQAVLFIANDQLSPFDRIGLEVIGMIYGYNCSGDDALNNTVFIHYELRNTSTQTLFDTYFGQWTDFDLGNFADDYIGSDVSRGAYYAYNGDDLDENNSGIIGYGNSIPAQACVFLGGVPRDNDSIDNDWGAGWDESVNGTGFGDGIIDNERYGLTGFMAGSSAQSSPATGIDFYNLLRSYWTDGTPQVYGGTGHVSSPNATSFLSDFTYPGDSDSLAYGTGQIAQNPWSEVTEGNAPGDRRGLGMSGPFTLNPWENIEIDLAYVWGRDPNGTTANDGVLAMQANIDAIRTYFDSNFGPCGFLGVSVPEQINPLDKIEAYPNPATDFVQLDGLPQEASWQLYNLLGESLRQGNANDVRVEVSDLPAGIYLLTVQSVSHQKTFKIIHR